MPNIAIVGSGPTAIYTAQYLLASHEAMTITMFEMQQEAGKGTPYHQDWNDKEMLSNIASIEIPPVTETLVQWLESQSDEQLAGHGIAREEIDERAFFPRVVLGVYFQDQLKKLQARALLQSHQMVIKPQHRVTDVMVLEEGIALTVNNAQSINYPVFDYVVMATGHVWPKETEIREGYFLSPWPTSALATIKNCHVGIRGTSLSAIDAMVALSVARGVFERDDKGELQYLAEPGTEAFRITMMSRKGILPEADFFHPIPYLPLQICNAAAIDKIIHSGKPYILEDIFALFKTELTLCDPDYAARIGLDGLTLEEFHDAYFRSRQEVDPFVWAEQNLAEAKANQANEYTVPWRYAILRMHEVLARMVPRLCAEEHARFSHFFKPVFVDDYATVPHESIERILALHRAGKLEVKSIGDDNVDTQSPQCGAIVSGTEGDIHYPAFIEAMGQRVLSVQRFPFPSLWKQGIITNATATHVEHTPLGQLKRSKVDIGGVALDKAFHPVSGDTYVNNLYCLSIPFMLGQFPFAQGITSSHEMGKKVASDIISQQKENSVMIIENTLHTESNLLHAAV